MRPSPLQFAVVREDPSVELALVDRFAPRRVALIASGGCTAFTLASQRPEVALTLIDANPAQLAHVEVRLDALRHLHGVARARAFNVDDDAPTGLSACGNFEGLFRGLRDTLRTFGVGADALRARLTGAADAADLVAHPYWRPAFDMWFSDPLLRAMFGPDAVQHAAPGSYPDYFRHRVEAELASPHRATNRFLHHLLLGAYLSAAAPPWLSWRPPARLGWTVHHGALATFDPEPVDLLHLSNVLDWMSPSAIDALGAHLGARCRPGAVITWRQLNNERDLAPSFPDFTFDAALEERLLAGERSMFYCRVRVGIRR